MKITDGRGQHMKKKQEDNINTVRKFFLENPQSTRKECHETTGLSPVTIRKSLSVIIKERQ